MTLCRRDLKPATLCEFEAAGRKANTVRAGTGKISVRKFMQGGSLPLRFFLPKTRLFVVVHSVGYLRAAARVRTVFLPSRTPRINGFSFEKPFSSKKLTTQAVFYCLSTTENARTFINLNKPCFSLFKPPSGGQNGGQVFL